VRLDFSRPSKPTDNATIESFHNSFRREYLTQHYFIDITDAQESIEQYRSGYNHNRRHSSSGKVPPARFRAAVAITASSSWGESGWAKLSVQSTNRFVGAEFEVTSHALRQVKRLTDKGIPDAGAH
jgi:hypothetical protein